MDGLRAVHAGTLSRVPATIQQYRPVCVLIYYAFAFQHEKVTHKECCANSMNVLLLVLRLGQAELTHVSFQGTALPHMGIVSANFSQNTQRECIPLSLC